MDEQKTRVDTKESPKRDDFELKEWETTFRGERYKLLEPTLPEGLSLQDNYFQLLVTEGSDSTRSVQIQMQEGRYIKEVCRKFVLPMIDVDKLPLRAHKQVRKLVREWEKKTGFGDLISALEEQVGSEAS